MTNIDNLNVSDYSKDIRKRSTPLKSDSNG